MARLLVSYNAVRLLFFFFNDTPTTEIYTLSLHDALPICCSTPISRKSWKPSGWSEQRSDPGGCRRYSPLSRRITSRTRSEEHTSELQSQSNLVCRLLLEKKKPLDAPLSTVRLAPLPHPEP